MHALNTLFEVLFTLCKALAPFTPFITDNIYKRLLPYIPKELQAADPRCVHFLSFPEVREELFNPVIERQIKRMQTIIELGRLGRDRRGIGVKMPLKTLVVLNRSQEFLDDVKTMEAEILAELNIINLVLTSDEEKYQVQYSLDAEWASLGKKLKKDAIRVKKALPSVSSDEIKEFLKTGKITIDGINLASEDFVVKRELKVDPSTKHQEFQTDNDVIVLLDTTSDPALVEQGLAREVINRVQRLRKKAGLKTTDDVGMEYHVLTDPENTGIEKVFESQRATFERSLRRKLDKHVSTVVEGDISAAKAGETVIISEEQEVQKATFMLRLVKLE